MRRSQIESELVAPLRVGLGPSPGVVQLTMLAPMDILEKRGLVSLVRQQYGL